MKLMMFILALTLVGCGATKYTSAKELVIEEAYQRAFVKGIESNDGTSSGTSYSVKFSKHEGCEVTGMWLSQQEIPIEVTEHDGDLYVVAMRYSSISIDTGEKRALPMEYDGKALLEYSFKGKTKYLIVQDFEVREATKGN